jgi:hypothetical protein
MVTTIMPQRVGRGHNKEPFIEKFLCKEPLHQKKIKFT